MARLAFLLYALSCLALTSALDILGRVTWNNVCPDAGSLGQAKALLDDGTMSSGITRNGSFVIPDVPDGTYLLSIRSHDFLFDQIRIDVNNSFEHPEARPYVPGTPMNPEPSILLPYPLSLAPRGKQIYFVAPESFSLVAMLSNPMMLLMVGGGIMMLAMPYLIKNMDPEMLEEFKGHQAKMGGFQEALQNGDLKSSLVLMTGAEGSPAPSNKTVKPKGNKKASRR